MVLYVIKELLGSLFYNKFSVYTSILLRTHKKISKSKLVQCDYPFFQSFLIIRCEEFFETMRELHQSQTMSKKALWEI